MNTVDIREHTLRAVAGADDFSVRCLAPGCHWSQAQPVSAIDQESVLAAWGLHVEDVKSTVNLGFPMVPPTASYNRKDPASIAAHRLARANERAASAQKRLAARAVGQEVRRGRRESKRKIGIRRRRDRRNLWWAWSRTNWATRVLWILGHVVVLALALFVAFLLVVLILRALLPIILGGLIIYLVYVLLRQVLST